LYYFDISYCAAVLKMENEALTISSDTKGLVKIEQKTDVTTFIFLSNSFFSSNIFVIQYVLFLVFIFDCEQDQGHGGFSK